MNVINNLSEKKLSYFCLFLYIISYGILIINWEIYWDSWGITDLSISELINFIDTIGFERYWAYVYFFVLNNVIIARVSIFLFCLFAPLLIYKSLRRIGFIDGRESVLFLGLMLLIPFYQARISFINIRYTVDIFMFSIGLYLFTGFLQRKKIVYRILSLVIFAISFSTQSILVFYFIIFPIWIIYRSDYFIYKQDKAIIYFIKRIIIQLDFILLPFVIFGITKYTLNPPSGPYFDYNPIDISLKNLTDILIFRFPKVIFNNIVSSFYTGHLYSISATLLLTLLIIRIKILLHSNKLNLKSHLASRNFQLFVLSLFAIILAIFPYLAVGKEPKFGNWDSRHQLLLFLGTSLFIIITLRSIINLFVPTYRKVIFTTIILYLLIIFTFINLKFSLQAIKAAIKNDAISSEIQKNSYWKNYKTFVVTDNTNNYYNVFNTSFSFYEYTGVFYRIFGTTTRLAYDVQDKEKMKGLITLLKPNPWYKIADYQQDDRNILITIERGQVILDKIETLRLLYLRYFNNDSYKERLRMILKFKYKIMDEVD